MHVRLVRLLQTHTQLTEDWDLPSLYGGQTME